MISRLIRHALLTARAALSRLFNEVGIRAEFQSSCGLILLSYWLIWRETAPTDFVWAVDRVLQHGHFGIILLAVGLFQTAANLGWHPRARAISVFLSFMAWSALAAVGYLAAHNFLVVPLATAFAITQGIVFVHLEKVPSAVA
jgi:hypothetical protein